MIIKENVIADNAVILNIKKIINQIYKLLPGREEGLDWESPLNTIIIELLGMNDLLPRYQDLLFSLVCKLQGLHSLKAEEEFISYRRTIFECLTLCQKIIERIAEGE